MGNKPKITIDRDNQYVAGFRTSELTLPVEREVKISIRSDGTVSFPLLCAIKDIDEVIAVLFRLKGIAKQRKWGI